MKKSVFSILILAMFVVISAKSHALLANDSGYRGIMTVLTSRSVDSYLQSLKESGIIPTRVQGVEFDRCDTSKSPIACTYNLKFNALGEGNDNSTYRCILKVDVANDKASNVRETSCVVDGQVLGR